MERRDRLARFGVGHFDAALAARGGRVVVVDDGASSDDRVGDMIKVCTWMCAGRYGRRGARNRVMCALTATQCDPGEGA